MKRLGVGLLLVVCCTYTSAAAHPPLEKLALAPPLTLTDAMQAADWAGCDELYSWRRLDERTIRLRCVHDTHDLLNSDGELIGHLGPLVTLRVTQPTDGRLRVRSHGRGVPLPD